MPDGPRLLDAGTDGLLVEVADLEAALALFEAIRRDPPDGLVDLVPAARTVMLRFDPLRTDRGRLAVAISRIEPAPAAAPTGRTVEIPVVYDGEDLADVAAHLGWSVETLIRRHTAAVYTVAFTGFAPGFAYMTADDPAFDLPRRPAPRARIPAGSVALAGRFGGIYPSDSPGGWQLIGRTPLVMWDARRPRAALLAPGDRVVFRDLAMAASMSVPASAPHPETAPRRPDRPGLRVTRADRPVLFQDLGRPGQAGQGVAPSGALDRTSLIEANLAVGNAAGQAALEIAYGGFALCAERPVTLALAGAPAPATLLTADGRRIEMPHGRPFALDEGDALELGPPPRGSRSYLALRGGFSVGPVLGSVATDSLARIGPEPIAVGDCLLPADGPAGSVDPDRPPPRLLPRAGDRVAIDILLGPRDDRLAGTGLVRLLGQDFEVTERSNRIGARLSAVEPLETTDAGELPSEAVTRGAIQLPHDGRPVLFLSDHPLTGGYPVIAVVAAHHLDLAGQIPIGGRIRFNAIADPSRVGAKPVAASPDPAR